MKFRQEEEILSDFLDLTKAVAVMPTPEEIELAAQLEERKRRAMKDAQVARDRNEKAKREAEFLQRAREAVLEAGPGGAQAQA